MSTSWKTKYGIRRVRMEPPTIEEALFAAEGLTQAVEQQIHIAAVLMQVPSEQVRAAARRVIKTKAYPPAGASPRSGVVIERKGLRRVRGQRPLNDSSVS
jgi:hypothetical protein